MGTNFKSTILSGRVRSHPLHPSHSPLLRAWILTGLLVTKIYKNRTIKISLFNCSMLGYISPIIASLPISIEEILVQPISLNPHTRLDFKHHPTQEYFRQIYHYLGPFCRFLLPGLISSTIFCKKLDFPTASHKRYILYKNFLQQQESH